MIREWQRNAIRRLIPLMRVYDILVISRATREGDQFCRMILSFYVSTASWYANVDRHLAAHQKPLILIRLSDYSAAATCDGDVRVWEIILPVW